MAFKIFIIDRGVLTKPCLVERAVDVVVVDPVLIAGIVGWIYVDAFYTACIARKQCFERVQVITMDDQVAVGVSVGSYRAIEIGFKRTPRNSEMVGVDELFAFEVK